MKSVRSRLIYRGAIYAAFRLLNTTLRHVPCLGNVRPVVHRNGKPQPRLLRGSIGRTFVLLDRFFHPQWVRKPQRRLQLRSRCLARTNRSDSHDSRARNDGANTVCACGFRISERNRTGAARAVRRSRNSRSAPTPQSLTRPSDSTISHPT